MFALIAFLSIFVVSTVARLEGTPMTKAYFESYKTQFNKVYSPAEETYRYQNFLVSLERVQQKKEEYVRREIPSEFPYGLTIFSDMSEREFAATKLTHLKPSTQNKKKLGVLSPPSTSVPQSFDWRDQGAVTAVKNQAQCGSCWAFSVTENIESVWILAGHGTNTTVILSPQQIVDCDHTDAGCDGGNPPTAYEYVIKAGGLEPNSDYPYVGHDQSCKFKAADVEATISSWKYATTAKNETLLQQNLVSWAPLSICVDAASWQDYSSGVVMGSQCGKSLDHCVQLVGYNMGHNPPYWIVRNSWTTQWGMDGYILLEYGQNTCGMAQEATTAIASN